jgi:mediator of RNA polymerase II transcription subunit 16
MASKEMPLILDTGMNMPLGDVGGVDDLFGEGTGLSLRPPSKQIHRRMDVLRNRGSCQ